MGEACWCFQCPECGFGSQELGGLAKDQELVCEVCLEEGRGEVRLHRWEPARQPVLVYARFRGGLAA
ncbi:MAG: hypothetical protein JO227_21295 [Acetobacteraceae bacterium]|nr:hypothetical protein [Acetobacteraceae bacterium]